MSAKYKLKRFGKLRPKRPIGLIVKVKEENHGGKSKD